MCELNAKDLRVLQLEFPTIDILKKITSKRKMTHGDAVMTCEEWDSKHSSDKVYQLGTVVQVKKVKLPKEHADGESGNAFIQQCQEKKIKRFATTKKDLEKLKCKYLSFLFIVLVVSFFYFF